MPIISFPLISSNVEVSLWILASIHKLNRKNVKFIWGKDQQDAFDKLKHLFTSSPILKNPDSDKPFIIETDASNFAVGAVLSQEFEGKLHPVAKLLASVSTIKGLSLSGFLKIGAEVNKCFNVEIITELKSQFQLFTFQ